MIDSWASLVLPRGLEAVSAGFPSPAEGYEDEPLNLHDWLVTNPAATFFYRVTGDALCAEHIVHGSVLIVDRSRKPEKGRLLLVEAFGEFAVMRYRDLHEARVCGVIVGVVRRL